MKRFAGVLALGFVQSVFAEQGLPDRSHLIKNQSEFNRKAEELRKKDEIKALENEIARDEIKIEAMLIVAQDTGMTMHVVNKLLKDPIIGSLAATATATTLLATLRKSFSGQVAASIMWVGAGGLATRSAFDDVAPYRRMTSDELVAELSRTLAARQEAIVRLAQLQGKSAK